LKAGPGDRARFIQLMDFLNSCQRHPEIDAEIRQYP